MAEKHYIEQVEYARSYLIPFLKNHIPHFEQKKVLEIGCAEAGLLAVLAEMGLQVTGLELSADRVKLSKSKNAQLDVRVGDLTDPNLAAQLKERYDLIILREVIEHVTDRQAAFRNLDQLLADDGWLYITFPPRFSAFAGHQQMGRSMLRRIPFLHYCPGFILRPLGRWCQEHDFLIAEVLRNFRIGLSIRRFEGYVRQHGFSFSIKGLFFIRPIYQLRFGWKSRQLPNLFLLREVLATGCECLLTKQR